MMIYVYDKNLELQGALTGWEYLIWTRKFCSCSTFDIRLKFTAYNYDLLQTEWYLYKKDTDEWAIIEDITVNDDLTDTFDVFGRGLSSILDRRMIAAYTATGKQISSVLYELVDQNCINPVDSNRKISNMIAIPHSVGAAIDLELLQRNLLDTLSETALEHSIGFSVGFNLETKKLYFEVLEARDRTDEVIFCKEFGNVLSQVYYRQTKNYKNVAYNREGAVIGDAKGLDRREVYAEDPKTYKIIDSLETSVNMKAYPYYKEDYNLGDLVATKSTKLGIEKVVLINEIKESYDSKGVMVETVFGDPIPDLLTLIKRDIKSGVV